MRLLSVFQRFKGGASPRDFEKVIIGSANIGMDGWLATDRNTLDVTDAGSFARNWPPNSRLAFFAEHVWEHLSLEQGRAGAENCFRFLRRGGRLRIAVPDGLFPDPAYIEAVRPGGKGAGAEDHKILYTYQSLRELLETIGFEVHLLEYWDEHGQFHAESWDDEFGHVRRSRRFDPRNSSEKCVYTSLIVDGVKP